MEDSSSTDSQAEAKTALELERKRKKNGQQNARRAANDLKFLKELDEGDVDQKVFRSSKGFPASAGVGKTPVSSVQKALGFQDDASHVASLEDGDAINPEVNSHLSTDDDDCYAADESEEDETLAASAQGSLPRTAMLETAAAPLRGALQGQVLRSISTLSQMGSNCMRCKAAQSLIRCEECNLRLCAHCDDDIHQLHPLHDRTGLLGDLGVRPLMPLQTVDIVDGKPCIIDVRSARCLPCVAPCACVEQPSAWKPLLPAGKSLRRLVFINLQGSFV